MIFRRIPSQLRLFNLCMPLARFSGTKLSTNLLKQKQIIDKRGTSYNLEKQQQTSECWNCNSRNFQSNLFVCGSCHHLQDPSESITSMNFFKLFELNLQFSIDQQELTSRYKDLQKSFHPDKFYTFRNKKIIKFSETYSSYINEAYSTLKDDLKRGEYLLEVLQCGKVKEPQNQISESSDYLNKMMMLRMEIEEASNDLDLQNMKQDLESSQAILGKQVDNFLQNKNYKSASQTLVEMRFNQSALEDIRQRLDTR